MQANHFIFGTFGLLPMVLYFVYLGTTISNIQDVINGNLELNTLTIVLYVIGALLGLAVLVSVTLVVRRILQAQKIDSVDAAPTEVNHSPVIQNDHAKV